LRLSYSVQEEYWADGILTGRARHLKLIALGSLRLPQFDTSHHHWLLIGASLICDQFLEEQHRSTASHFNHNRGGQVFNSARSQCDACVARSVLRGLTSVRAPFALRRNLQNEFSISPQNDRQAVAAPVREPKP